VRRGAAAVQAVKHVRTTVELRRRGACVTVVSEGDDGASARAGRASWATRDRGSDGLFSCTRLLYRFTRRSQYLSARTSCYSLAPLRNEGISARLDTTLMHPDAEQSQMQEEPCDYSWGAELARAPEGSQFAKAFAGTFSNFALLIS